jgi:hypothetical protein
MAEPVDTAFDRRRGQTDLVPDGRIGGACIVAQKRNDLPV